LFISLLADCKASRTVKGGAIGAAPCGVVSGLIGSASKRYVENVITGAVVGGASRALWKLLSTPMIN